MSANEWENWAGSLYAYPSQLLTPSSVAELEQIVQQNQNKVIRAAGTGHSWSPLVPTDAVLVDATQITQEGQKAWRWQKDGMNLVSFVPSATWQDVREALIDPNVNYPRMYLPTAGVFPSINATGFMAAGCHGTGWDQPTLADLMYAIELVSADGQVHVFSEDTTPNLMNVVRVNLGMLGIISKITLKVEEMYNLWDQELVTATSNVMGPNPADNNGEVNASPLRDWVVRNDYTELFWFPWSGWKPDFGSGKLTDGSIWVKLWNRTSDGPRDEPAQVPDWQSFIAQELMEWVAENTPRGASGHDTIPGIEWAMWKGLNSSIQAVDDTHGFVAEAPIVFHYQDKAFPLIDLEVAIPIPSTGENQWDFTNVVRAWYEVVNAVRSSYDNNVFPLTICMHARFIKNSQALLSPAYEPAGSETHYCWIEFLSAYPKQVQDAATRDAMIADYRNLRNQIATTWITEYKGRPHWAKYWQDIPGLDVRSLYPAANLSQFNDLRSSLDPGLMFMNSFLRDLNLFGG
jgi:hypothetical protein